MPLRERKLAEQGVFDIPDVKQAFTDAGVSLLHLKRLYRQLLNREQKKIYPSQDENAAEDWIPKLNNFPKKAKQLLLNDFKLLTTTIIERKDSDNMHTTKLLVRLQVYPAPLIHNVLSLSWWTLWIVFT